MGWDHLTVIAVDHEAEIVQSDVAVAEVVIDLTANVDQEARNLMSQILIGPEIETEGKT